VAHFKALCLHVTRRIVNGSNIRLAPVSRPGGFKVGTF